jgi:putative exosortase-associated protein (TIGR04073 family)
MKNQIDLKPGKLFRYPEALMKYLVLGIVLVINGSAFADIQDPPSNDYGPTRKLGRGLSNFFLGSSEIFVTVGKINKDEGNAAAAGYGVVRGFGRSAARHFAGLAEIFTFPFPAWRESYSPMLPSDIPWIHAGFGEFPPELGNESKYPYVRDY